MSLTQSIEREKEKKRELVERHCLCRLLTMETQPLLTKPARKKVHIVYYLSRGTQVDQPHLIEGYLPLSQDGLRLKEFKKWLSILRGRSIPSSFAWAYKRIYRNGYIWHDLSDSDLIQPLCKNEYVLIGSEIRNSVQDKCKCGVGKGSYSFKQEEDFQTVRTDISMDDFSNSGPTMLGANDHNEDHENKVVATSGITPSGTSISNEAQVADEIRTNDFSPYKARTPAFTTDQSTDAATQTGESKRCSTEEVCTSLQSSHVQPPAQSPRRLSLTDQAPNLLSPSAASTPNLRTALESPDSQASSSALKSNPNTKRNSKHNASSQVLKQLLSCGSVDIDESSILNLKSFTVQPTAMITHHSPRYEKAWSFRNSGGSSIQYSRSVSGFSDSSKDATGSSPAESLLLRKALMSSSRGSPKRGPDSLNARDMSKGDETHASPRRNLQFDDRKGSNAMAQSPRVSISDNFTANWREMLWSPKKDVKQGWKKERRHHP